MFVENFKTFEADVDADGRGRRARQRVSASRATSRDALRAGHRPRDSRAAADRVEDLLRLQHRVRRAAEHARLSGLPRACRARCRCSTARPSTSRIARGARARLRRPRDVDLRAEELLLSRPAEGLPDLAVRAAARERRRASSSPAADGRARVGITRVHMEEDAGKSLHEGFRRLRPQDLRRLQPQRRAAHRDRHRARPAVGGRRGRVLQPPARACSCGSASTTATWKRAACAATPTCRCGPSGTTTLGTKAEVKNLNSFRFLQKALEYEIERQIDVARATAAASCRKRGCGTRRAGATVSMRSKEEAHDYRYFPEPDLPPLVVDAGARRRDSRRRCRSCRTRGGGGSSTAYGLPEYDAGAADAVARRSPTTSRRRSRAGAPAEGRRATG